MRYTTIIDISEIPSVYRNRNARIVYLHLALKSGYHDDDRDLIEISIRRLADASGLSVSATRHALRKLSEAGLITKQDNKMAVKKWIIQDTPSPRQKKPTSKEAEARAKALHDEEQRRIRDEQVREYYEALKKALQESSREELEQWLQELKDGRSLRHHGGFLKANKDNIDWLSNYIQKL